MAKTSTTFQGSYLSYPAPPGDKRLTMKLLNGPSSYTQITNGAAGNNPPTGGWQVKASDLGLVEIEAILCCVSNDGKYNGIGYPTKAQTSPQTTVAFEIVITHTGAEETGTTDISAQSFLIVALGN